jgi:endoglucanase
LILAVAFFSDGSAVSQDHPVKLAGGGRFDRMAEPAVEALNEGRVESGSESMARITDTNSPAHRAARRLMRGTNLGNHLEAPAGQNWGATYSMADFAIIRQEGFDHVRLPIRWNDHTGPGPDFVISNAFKSKVDFLVTNALARGLGVIVNIHHFDDFTSDPAGQTEKFLALWRQIAEHYATAPEGVVFELLNEPKDAATTEVINPIYARAIRVIRESNPERTILVGPGSFNSIDELGALRLPGDDANLIVTVHNYDPFLFTHQGAGWTMPTTATRGIVFPGPPETPLEPAAGIPAWAVDWIERYNTVPGERNPSSPAAFREAFALARQWSKDYGRPVHLGEFGAYSRHCDDDSRVKYYRSVRESMDEHGMGWAMWDWKAGFHYWEGDEDGGPDPAGLREALFPRPD